MKVGELLTLSRWVITTESDGREEVGIYTGTIRNIVTINRRSKIIRYHKRYICTQTGYSNDEVEKGGGNKAEKRPRFLQLTFNTPPTQHQDMSFLWQAAPLHGLANDSQL